MTTDELCEKAIQDGVWEVNFQNGAVYSNRAKRYIGGLNTKGYRIATLHLNKERRQVKLHRFVWIAAHGIPSLGYVIDHIDGNKEHNWLKNLRLADAVLNSNNRRSYKGEENPAAKLNRTTVNMIRSSYELTGIPYKKLSQKYKVSPTLIAKIIRKEIWN